MTELDMSSSSPDGVRDAFYAAITTALWELAQSEAIVEDASPEVGGDVEGPRISATMRLGRAAPGQLTLTVPVPVAEQLAGRYLPEGTTLSDDIVDDVVGEFANVIGGQAKTMLKHSPFHFLMSPPSVSRSSVSLSTVSLSSDTSLAVSRMDGRSDGGPGGTDSSVVACVNFRIEIEFGPFFLTVRLPWCPDAAEASK